MESMVDTVVSSVLLVDAWSDLGVSSNRCCQELQGMSGAEAILPNHQ